MRKMRRNKQTLIIIAEITKVEEVIEDDFQQIPSIAEVASQLMSAVRWL